VGAGYYRLNVGTGDRMSPERSSSVPLWGGAALLFSGIALRVFYWNEMKPRIGGMTPDLMKVFKMTHLHNVLKIKEHVADAIASL